MTVARPARRLPSLAGLAKSTVAGLVTPLAPADVVALVAPLLAGDQLRGRVVQREAEAGDAVTLTIRTGRGWRPHRPGQYVRVGIDVDGVRHWRAYSVTSVPHRLDGRITITVHNTGGLVSSYLHDDAVVGTLVHLDVAAGDFVLPERLPEKIVFITGGSGITPIMAMLRSYRFGDVVLVHSSRDPDAVILGAELREHATARGLRLIEHHSESDGRLDADRLRALVPDWAEREAYACGPAGLIDIARSVWADAGRAEQFHAEAFSAPVAAADDAGPGSATFLRSKVTAEADGGVPVLEAGERAGVLLKSGCRSGICYTCVAPLVAGTVRDLRTGVETTAAAGDRVMIQTCVNAAVGPCSLDV